MIDDPMSKDEDEVEIEKIPEESLSFQDYNEITNPTARRGSSRLDKSYENYLDEDEEVQNITAKLKHLVNQSRSVLVDIKSRAR